MIQTSTSAGNGGDWARLRGGDRVGDRRAVRERRSAAPGGDRRRRALSRWSFLGFRLEREIEKKSDREKGLQR